MRRLFVDTSAWCAIYDKDDKCHPQAVSFLKEITQEFVQFTTSEYIFNESITLVRARVSHDKARKLGEWLLNPSNVELIEVTREIRDAAWKIFLKN